VSIDYLTQAIEREQKRDILYL